MNSATRSGLPGTGASLRERGAILLVSCYELGHQPLALASPLGFLERAGYAPEALDISVEPLDLEKISRARLVGISVPMHTALRLGVRVAEEVRRVNPGCHICCYGLYAALNAEGLLAHGADSAIGGEFESALVELAETLERNASDPVAGVHRRGRPAPPIMKRLEFAAPSRGALPRLEQYAHLEQQGERRLAGYVEASRGCRHLCLHCPIPPVYGGRFFVVPKALVLEDIRRLAAAGATHITFGDPDFLNGPGHSLAIVRAMQREFPQLTFDFTAKVEHVLARAALFPELGRLGCLFIVSAVESLSDAVLGILNKGHTRAGVHRALSIVRAAGIGFRPTWVPFTPWTTAADYVDMLDFVAHEGLIDHVDPVQFTLRLLIPPGSLLLERDAVRPHLGALDPAAFSFRWTHPDPRMDRLQREAAGLVEAAAGAEEDPAVTFCRLRLLAHETLGLPPPPDPALSPHRGLPPRLTEAWFC